MVLKPFTCLVGLALIAVPAIAQEMPERETPRGTYLVFADLEGSAFVSYEPSLAETGVWPLSFFYYQNGVMAGQARIAASAECVQGIVRGQLTHAMDETGQVMALPQNSDAPLFAFDRAGGGGDQAIVDFVCGTGQERLVQAETPIYNSLEATAHSYAQLRALGLDHRISRSLAIRDRETADPLIETAVPEELRDAARAALDPRH
jgi:hypothetical protein